MKRFIGTKIIQAEPAEALVPMGSHLKGAEGYKVVYPDGYESWSHKEVFEEAYRPTDGANFGLAVEAMKEGFRIQMPEWVEAGIFVQIARDYEDEINEFIILPCFTKYVSDGEFQPGWTPSAEEMLRDDWIIMDMEELEPLMSSKPIKQGELGFPGSTYDRPIYIKQVGGKYGTFTCPECGKPYQQHKFSANQGWCSGCGFCFQSIGHWQATEGDKEKTDYWAWLERLT
jgi:hypothetical protein